MANTEVISQELMRTARDYTIALARMPDTAVEDGGSISHAVRYQPSDELIVISLVEDETEQSNPNFNIEQTVVQSSDEHGRIDLEHEFNFSVSGSPFQSEPRYDLTFMERILARDPYGKPVQHPLIDPRPQSRLERRAQRVRQDEIDRLHHMIGLGELTVSKFEDLLRSLGKCGLKNRMAVGGAAYYDEG